MFRLRLSRPLVLHCLELTHAGALRNQDLLARRLERRWIPFYEG